MANLDHPKLDIFRPPIEVYCTFLDYYLYFFSIDTVKSYIRRVNTAAVERCGHPIRKEEATLWIKRTYDAAAKRGGPAVTNTRLPLTLDILAKLRPLFDFSRHNDRALWAILCVGIFCLARIGELVPGSSSKLKVTVGSVSIRGGKGVISLVGTKTDRKMKGIKLIFFKNDSSCCPVTAMAAYLSARPTSPLFVDGFDIFPRLGF